MAVIQLDGYDIEIDDEDVEKVLSHTWCVNRYILSRTRMHYFLTSIYVNGKKAKLSLHRFIMGCVHGDGLSIDHIDHNGLNLHKSNLRVCDHASNGKNLTLSTKNTSGYKGVSWNKARNMWESYIFSDGKRYFLRCYKTAVEAARMYNCASMHLHKEFANPNIGILVDEDTENLYYEIMSSIVNKVMKRPYIGVVYILNTDKYRAEIMYNRKRITLGYFNSAEEAARAYDKKAIEVRGSNAKTNFNDYRGAL